MTRQVQGLAGMFALGAIAVVDRWRDAPLRFFETNWYASSAERRPRARMVVIYKSPRDPQTFDQHYFDVHVPMAKRLLGLRRYDVGRAILTPAGGSTPHLIATLHFDDLPAISNAFASPEGQACEADRRLLAPDDADLQMYLFDTTDV